MRLPYRKSTVGDVALRAGVSQSAVSHYINGRVNVCAPETAARIERAIEELHFTPARAMRHMRQRPTHTIGVCVSLLFEDHAISSNSYLHRFWAGVTELVDQQSYRVMLFPKTMRNSESCSPFLDGGIDGLLISAGLDDPRPQVLAEAGLPVVSVVRSVNLPKGCGSVVAKQTDVADLAMTHLRDLGHRRIGYYGPDPFRGRTGAALQESDDGRYRGWKQWAERAGDDPDAYARYAEGYGYPDPDAALTAADHWRAMPEPPTAVFCASDRLAMSLITAFRKRGVSVPGDISIVGVDNEDAGASFDPPLTSVDIPVFEIGFEAARMLVDIVSGNRQAESLEIPVSQLVVRRSTDAPRNGL